MRLSLYTEGNDGRVSELTIMEQVEYRAEPSKELIIPN